MTVHVTGNCLSWINVNSVKLGIEIQNKNRIKNQINHNFRTKYKRKAIFVKYLTVYMLYNYIFKLKGKYEMLNILIECFVQQDISVDGVNPLQITYYI